MGWVSSLGCVVFLWHSIVLVLPLVAHTFWSFLVGVGLNGCFSWNFSWNFMSHAILCGGICSCHRCLKHGTNACSWRFVVSSRIFWSGGVLSVVLLIVSWKYRSLTTHCFPHGIFGICLWVVSGYLALCVFISLGV